MSNDTGDIQSLFPNREIVVGGETIVLRPFYFGELPVVIRLVQPVIAATGLSRMLRAVRGPDGRFEIKMDVPENVLDIFADLLLEATEPVIELISYAIKKDRAWFNTIQSDEGIDLTTAWFEVNRDFFVQRVLPRIAKMHSAGTTSSPSSLEPATGEATSTVTP